MTAYEACTILPIAQMNPASSRAIAVTATVSFLPRAASDLYRAHTRACAFMAMSRTAGDTRSWTLLRLAAAEVRRAWLRSVLAALALALDLLAPAFFGREVEVGKARLATVPVCTV
jgi:hypothetical protein